MAIRRLEEKGFTPRTTAFQTIRSIVVCFSDGYDTPSELYHPQMLRSRSKAMFIIKVCCVQGGIVRFQRGDAPLEFGAFGAQHGDLLLESE